MKRLTTLSRALTLIQTLLPAADAAGSSVIPALQRAGLHHLRLYRKFLSP